MILRWAEYSPDRIPSYQEESDEPPRGPIVIQSWSRVIVNSAWLAELGMPKERMVVYWSVQQ